ncbi:universal stress protein [Paracoccus benzoatiresistens]|uniref:Universal stress protein n=1 Tax=Paracoccus benzoatiresistens TaxID=2997341 RepID=A0ABT4JBM9_9RHOB|nr:universal stress protein [Paracoccus sp. EF6]MCZ0964537.1 universal stress protein [Paracoccus sp. EF6]
MSIRTIGLALLSVESTEWLTTAACALAQANEAHVIGVHAADPIIPYMSEAVYDPVLAPEFLDWQVEEALATRTSFEAVVKRAGVTAEFRGQEIGLNAEAFLLDGLRACDLIVSPALEQRSLTEVNRHLQEQLIRNSGRPVLVLPQKHPIMGPVMRLMIGVSPTREATRAAHDALMLAGPGAAIDLVSVTPASQPRRMSFDFRQDLAAAFDRLGFKVNLVDRDGRAGETGEVLMTTALELGAELVVTGAFGHSRSYDFIVGAATSYLLDHAHRPVLYAK